ncbi:hypothetical protein CJ030_MR2G023038 [Morella rubra]|uniref:RNase H type-1 domain-containing protein n=1 Tax=Morella rubra TaxID=262757 RepID=A0A6A1UMM9_9ROSI|nr:hypothetical protein CJ030_MR8G008977 [Morella rubra]KAB1223636.1 hypothetical protein CJ030_MR2G023038 [Morella rubra]
MEAECFASKKWVPPPCGWLKVNMDVAIRQNGSYIAIFVRDSYSSLCLVYIERLVAMDPIVREAFAWAEAVSLARWLKWDKVLFECDSLLVCKDVLFGEPPQLWAASGMVEHIWFCLLECHDWRIAWVSRKCNLQAHLLAGWAARFGIVGFVPFSIIPEHIRGCDMHP